MEESVHLSDKELKALVSLLDDEDAEVIQHVEGKIKSLGLMAVPYLESAWEDSFNPVVQKRIEELVHMLQFEFLQEKLKTWKEEGAKDLLEGVWLVNTYQYPDLAYEDLKKELEQLYYEAWLEFKSEAYPLDKVKLLNSVIFNKLKFGANTKNFHSPGNSMMNVVLQNRKGNPISLCIIYMLVAQKLKMPIYGVNLPNLFILTYKEGDNQFYINAFNRGLIFSRKDIDNYISHLNLPSSDIFYEPCTNLDIVVRVLRNLLSSYEKLGHAEKTEEARQLIQLLTGER